MLILMLSHATTAEKLKAQILDVFLSTKPQLCEDTGNYGLTAKSVAGKRESYSINSDGCHNISLHERPVKRYQPGSVSLTNDTYPK